MKLNKDMKIVYCELDGKLSLAIVKDRKVSHYWLTLANIIQMQYDIARFWDTFDSSDFTDTITDNGITKIFGYYDNDFQFSNTAGLIVGEIPEAEFPISFIPD